MAARIKPDDCMFCSVGVCPTHSPAAKPKVARRAVPKIVQLPSTEEAQPAESAASTARRAQVQAAKDDLAEFAPAIRALVPLLNDTDLVKHKELIGPERVERQLKVNKWKRERRNGAVSQG